MKYMKTFKIFWIDIIAYGKWPNKFSVRLKRDLIKLVADGKKMFSEKKQFIPGNN